MKHTPNNTREKSEAYLASDVGKNAPYALVVAAICRLSICDLAQIELLSETIAVWLSGHPHLNLGHPELRELAPERTLPCAQEMIISIAHYATLLNFVWVLVYCVGLPESPNPPLHDGPEDQPTVRTELGDSQ